MSEEVKEIAVLSKRNSDIPNGRCSRLNQFFSLIVKQPLLVLSRLFSQISLPSQAGISILEINCGSGTNLLGLIELGAKPSRQVCNEMLAAAIGRLAASVRLLTGYASQLLNALPLFHKHALYFQEKV